MLGALSHRIRARALATRACPSARQAPPVFRGAMGGKVESPAPFGGAGGVVAGLHVRHFAQMPVEGNIRPPPLRSPSLPEMDVKDKTVMYTIGSGWLVLYTSSGRPYYYQPSTGKRQWEHPETGVYIPPNRAIDNRYKLSPEALKRLDYTMYTFFSMMGFWFFGGIVILGRLSHWGESNSEPRVVQVEG
mmetsp:Transcript_3574/g.7846  ORF Transcript_3574/g.7846 Transcript_3574/m.7846 type:complete len:189 (+) Transcript_3574:84-650(+)